MLVHLEILLLLVLFSIIISGVSSNTNLRETTPKISDDTNSTKKNITWEDIVEDWLEADGNECQVISDIWGEYCDTADDSHESDPQLFCSQLKDRYDRVCEKTDQIDVELLITLLTVAFCIVTATWFEMVDFYWVAGAGSTILIGLMVGGISYLIGRMEDGFSESFFYLFLLPPIIFEAGIEINKTLFLKELGSIVSFSILGTVCSIMMVFGILAPLNLLPLLECSTFGTLIAAVDPVPILAIFNNFYVETELFTIVFAESALNDGIVVVIYQELYEAMAREEHHRSINIVELIYTVLYVFIGSMALGTVFAFLSAWFLKWAGLNTSKLRGIRETCILVLWSLVPYYISESIGLSGIVTLLFEGIFIDLYAFQNLSEVSKYHFRFVSSSLAYFCETMIVAYLGIQIILSPEKNWRPELISAAMGAVLASRLLIFLICWIINLFRKVPLPFHYQVGLWFARLRGGVAFALAYNIPTWNDVTNTGSEYRGDIVATTLAVILIEVFLFGTYGIVPLLKMAGLKIHGTEITLNRLSEEPPHPPPSHGNSGSLEAQLPTVSWSWYQRKMLYLHHALLLPYLTHFKQPASRTGSHSGDSGHGSRSIEEERLVF